MNVSDQRLVIYLTQYLILFSPFNYNNNTQVCNFPIYSIYSPLQVLSSTLPTWILLSSHSTFSKLKTTVSSITPVLPALHFFMHIIQEQKKKKSSLGLMSWINTLPYCYHVRKSSDHCAKSVWYHFSHFPGLSWGQFCLTFFSVIWMRG